MLSGSKRVHLISVASDNKQTILSVKCA